MTAPAGARARVVVVLGTRPEAIKLLPVIRALERSEQLAPIVVTTGQHPELAREVLALGGVRADHELDVMRAGASLDELTARLLGGLGPVLEPLAGEVAGLLVQGDTTTALVGALSAFYHGIPVGHVEAGLRTDDPVDPFPEEMNRRLVSRLASLHFAATPRARANLLAEGIRSARVLVTGNTVIDALQWAATLAVPWRDHALDDLDTDPRRVMVVTAHRRESWGEGIAHIADAVARVARDHADVRVVWSLHPNPAVRAEVVPRVEELANVTLTEPLEYAEFARLLGRAWLVCTDSGGVQEEAPALGVPVLVTRETTERPEAVEAGVARLVGTDPARIVAEATRLLDDPAAHAAMATVANPFGDGHAAARIVAALAHDVFGTAPPAAFSPPGVSGPERLAI